MARKVVWSYEATTDLETLAEYIAKDSDFYAAAFVQEIRDVSRSLAPAAARAGKAGFQHIRDIIP